MNGLMLAEVTMPSVAITQDMFKPVLDAVVSTIGVIFPIGIGIFALMIGVKMAPKILKKFMNQ